MHLFGLRSRAVYRTYRAPLYVLTLTPNPVRKMLNNQKMQSKLPVVTVKMGGNLLPSVTGQLAEALHACCVIKRTHSSVCNDAEELSLPRPRKRSRMVRSTRVMNLQALIEGAMASRSAL